MCVTHQIWLLCTSNNIQSIERWEEEKNQNSLFFSLGPAQLAGMRGEGESSFTLYMICKFPYFNYKWHISLAMF